MPCSAERQQSTVRPGHELHEARDPPPLQAEGAAQQLAPVTQHVPGRYSQDPFSKFKGTQWNDLCRL